MTTKVFHAHTHTEAPLQITVSGEFLHSAEKVWSVIADHQEMVNWMPMIKHVEIKNQGSNSDLGLHCERECTFGNDILKEKIVYWNPPKGYAYMIANREGRFFKNHLGHIEIARTKDDRTKVIWKQYFDPLGIKGWLMKNIMMPRIMKKGLRNLDKKLETLSKSIVILIFFFMGDLMNINAQPPEKNVKDEFLFEQKKMKVLDTEIAYIEQGNGQTVLFLHGLPTSSYLWRNIVPIVAKENHAIAIDLAGFGNSGQPKAYDLETQYSYLEGFIDNAALKNVTLVVNDLGSILGLMYATRHPDNIRQIVYMEALFMPIREWYAQLGGFQKIMFSMMKNRRRSERMFVKRNMMVRMLIPYGTKNKLSRAQKQAYALPFEDKVRRNILVDGPGPHQMGVAKKSGWQDETSKTIDAYASKLRQMNIPMLLLIAKPGMITKDEAIEYAKTYFKQIKIANVGKGKHFLPEDQPGNIGNEINIWLHENR